MAERQVHQAPQEREVNLARQVRPESLDQLDQQVQMADQDLQVPRVSVEREVRVDYLDLQVMLGQLDDQVKEENVVDLERPVQLDHLGHLVCQEVRDQEDHQVQQQQNTIYTV
eukprot:GHVU01020367.1.p2 GENE.GHVU01020367.1~~GHVU01020367.1.p2  ORF type:complete len:128 (+),score=22.30 GHVU01020367.1:46-384(+)